MSTSVRTRILLATNLLVAGVGLAVGWAGIELAGREIEHRVVDQSVQQAATVMGELPKNDRMMKYLAQFYGVDAAIGPQAKPILEGSSLSPEQTKELARQIIASPLPEQVQLGGKPYRLGWALIKPAEGAPREPVMRLYLLASQEQLRAAKEEVAKKIAWATLIAIGVVTVLCVWLSASISRPLRRLAGRMDRVAGQDQPPAALTGQQERLRGPAELRQLTESFDRLLARLDEANQQLERSARMAAVGQMSASIAHELRNPLSGIKMNARILADELGRGGKDDPSLQLIIREVERMDLYLEELLSLAAGGPAQQRPPQLSPQDLGELANSVVKLFEGRCRHAGVEIHRQYAPALPPVNADAAQIRQVIMNLLLNALEAVTGKSASGEEAAGREPPQIVIEAAPAILVPGGVRLSVRDNGTGVQVPRGSDIFEPLVTTKNGSPGLGLHICRQLATAHGGKIGFDSSTKGSTFWFELPAGGSGAEFA